MAQGSHTESTGNSVGRYHVSTVHELPLLVNTSIALVYALIGGLIARRIGLPTIVGYMVAGIALGPFTPGYRADPGDVRQLAEFGVILLMFGVGLHFSFRDLWRVRQIAVPGAILQMAIVSAIGYALGRAWGFPSAAAWVFGMALSVASTVVMTRSLMDYGWLDSPQGKVAVGWLVFEDLLTVAILVVLPALTTTSEASGVGAGILFALGQAGLFVGLMVVIGRYVMPFVLSRVVDTRSRELFVLVALTVAVGTALASAAFFSVSLALGAFVAGVVVSDSPFSHQISADLLPFREAFAVVFFVSVGMLVNPADLLARWDQVLVVTLLIVVGKGLISGLLGAILPAPGRTALVLAAGRSQIGEFSFIVGQSGIALGLLDNSQYSLILAGAFFSITLNALVFRLVQPAERALQRWPRVWQALNHGAVNIPVIDARTLDQHVVIVGCGRVGRHIAEALGRLNIPRLVVEADPGRLNKLHELGVPVLYGDASSSEILENAALDRARALVITLPDDAAALAVAATVKHEAPGLRMVARASTWEGARRLKAAGVQDVVRPELEGGVEIVRRTLLDIDLPVGEVQRYVDLVRNEGLDEAERPSAARARVLDHLMTATRGVEVVWVEVSPASPLAGRTIAESRLRSTTGASIVGIASGDAVTVNPTPEHAVNAGDRVAIIGRLEQIRNAETLLSVPGSGA
jgi:CPA2 family monovalent cation:H+ antiporter-2